MQIDYKTLRKDFNMAPGIITEDELGNPTLLENRSNDWIWCDERLPTAEEAKLQMNILVAELDHGEDPADPNAHWCIDVDYATYCENSEGYFGSSWRPDNDWDEGQPWAVIAWRTIPKLPDIDQVKCRRDIKWLNVKGPQQYIEDHLETRK